MFEAISDFYDFSKRLKSGDPKAYEIVYLEGLRIIIPFLRRKGFKLEDAEDLWGDFCVRLFEKKCLTYDPDRGQLSSWLIVGMARFACDWIDAEKQLEKLPIDDHLLELSSEDPLKEKNGSGTQDLLELLDQAKKSLNQLDLEILSLKFEEDLTNALIAEQLGISQATVRQRVFRAIKRLRLAVEKLNPDELRRRNKGLAGSGSSRACPTEGSPKTEAAKI